MDLRRIIFPEMDDFCALSLRIRHPSADLAEFCRGLGLLPKRAWRAGESRTTPQGRPLPGAWPNSYCTVDLGRRFKVAVLPRKIEDIAKKLKPFRTALAEIRQTGGEVSLFVGWFVVGLNSAETLSWELLDQLAELRISLELDIYGAGPEPEEARPEAASASTLHSPETR
jgi:hypothetical protein